MHVILSANGTNGNVLPYFGWAKALKERGHRVTIDGIPLLAGHQLCDGLDFFPVSSVKPGRKVDLAIVRRRLER